MLAIAFICFFALIVAWLLAPNAPARAGGAPATDNWLDTSGATQLARSVK